MTAQFTEQIVLNGQKRSLCTDPLESFFEMTGIHPEFMATSTALWRGYVGTWEVLNERLYLVDLNGKLKSGQVVGVGTIFPGFPERAFAHWYSGVLRIPMGKLLRYVHGGYGSVYERDQFVAVKKGVAVATSMVVNGEVPGSEATADEYAVHAMYSFAPNIDSSGDVS